MFIAYGFEILLSLYLSELLVICGALDIRRTVKNMRIFYFGSTFKTSVVSDIKSGPAQRLQACPFKQSLLMEDGEHIPSMHLKLHCVQTEEEFFPISKSLADCFVCSLLPRWNNCFSLKDFMYFF